MKTNIHSWFNSKLSIQHYTMYIVRTYNAYNNHCFDRLSFCFQDKNIHTVVIKPVFKCTPQIKALHEM
jgi:hypothetical protein